MSVWVLVAYLGGWILGSRSEGRTMRQRRGKGQSGDTMDLTALGCWDLILPEPLGSSQPLKDSGWAFITQSPVVDMTSESITPPISGQLCAALWRSWLQRRLEEAKSRETAGCTLSVPGSCLSQLQLKSERHRQCVSQGSKSICDILWSIDPHTNPVSTTFFNVTTFLQTLQSPPTVFWVKAQIPQTEY